jgi:ABC-type bacteriocin/lantibiotic exporter with double-glycine peptidase domain
MWGVLYPSGYPLQAMSEDLADEIAVARALYKNANIIILDEATSALDSDTERMVIQNIHQIEDKPTVIMVAHRISTLANCQRIFKIECGKIASEMTYSDIASITH